MVDNQQDEKYAQNKQGQSQSGSTQKQGQQNQVGKDQRQGGNVPTKPTPGKQGSEGFDDVGEDEPIKPLGQREDV